MDNNNSVTQQPTTNTVPPQPQPVASQTPVTPESPSGDSNKMILWLLIGLVVIVVSIGGIYLFLSKQQAAVPESQTTKTPIVQATPKPQDTVDALDRDLSSVNVADPNSDFPSVDQDLQQL